MQNKQALLGIVAAIVIILGAGLIYTLNKNKTPQPNSTVVSQSNKPSNSMVQSTIADIFKTTENKKCDFDTKTANGETKGTIYVSGNNSYGDFNMIYKGKSQEMFLVRNNDTFYMWGDALPSGVKMKMSVDQIASQMSGSQSSSFDASQKTDFKCTGWTVDSSKFTPPTNIKFLEMGSITAPSGTRPSGASQNPSASCSLCNSMTGDAKTACLSGLHCQ